MLVFVYASLLLSVCACAFVMRVFVCLIVCLVGCVFDCSSSVVCGCGCSFVCLYG